jgi:hypothetical protein
MEAVGTTVVCFRQSADEFEGIDPKKVLSHYPTCSAVEEKDYVVEIVNLSEGMLNWMRTFDENLDEIHFNTKRRTVLVVNCGPADIWLTAVFDAKTTELANIEELKRTLPIAIHNHTASLKGKNQQQQYQNLAATVHRYLEAKLKLESPTLHGLHNVLEGLPILSLRKQSFLMLRYLQNSLVELASGNDSPVSDTMLLYNNFILCSTLGAESTEKLYYKYVDHMLETKLMSATSPAFIPNADKRLSSAFNLKLNFNFDPLGTSSLTSEQMDSNRALSADGFVTQLDLVAREELTQAFTFQTTTAEEKEKERSVFISVQDPTGIAVVFLTRGVGTITSDLRKRISDLFKRSCPKLSETIRMDCEENEEKKEQLGSSPSNNFDVAAVDQLSGTSQVLQPFDERADSLKLRMDLAAQLRREFHLGGGNFDSGDSTTSELMVHSHNSVWASLQKSGLKRYYMISEEDTLIGAHVGMRKNAEKVFETCIP